MAPEGPVLVTGGTGFIGRHLVRRLCADGFTVRAFARQSMPVVGPPGVAQIAGDVRDADAVRQAIDGVRTVFHLAGRAHVTDERRDTGEHAEITVHGTRRVLAAAVEAGVSRFVFVSSLAVYGTALGTAPVDETTPPRPTTAYGRAKLEAEAVVQDARSRGAIQTVCLRPAMVYGPGCPGNLPRLIGLVDRGFAFLIPAVQNRRSFLHVENLVDALLLTAGVPVAGDGLYVVADAEAYSTSEIVDLIAQAFHHPPPRMRMPVAVLRGMARTGDVLTRIAGRRMLFDSVELEKLMGSAVVSSSRIARELGFVPTRTLEASIDEVVGAWRGAA